MAKVMTTQQKRDKYTKNGKGWCEDSLVSIEPYEHHGKSSVGVHIGEEYSLDFDENEEEKEKFMNSL